jgi:hypothetical protein
MNILVSAINSALKNYDLYRAETCRQKLDLICALKYTNIKTKKFGIFPATTTKFSKFCELTQKHGQRAACDCLGVDIGIITDHEECVNSYNHISAALNDKINALGDRNIGLDDYIISIYSYETVAFIKDFATPGMPIEASVYK